MIGRVEGARDCVAWGMPGVEMGVGVRVLDCEEKEVGERVSKECGREVVCEPAVAVLAWLEGDVWAEREEVE